MKQDLTLGSMGETGHRYGTWALKVATCEDGGSRCTNDV